MPTSAPTATCNDRVVTSAKIIRESGGALLLSAPGGGEHWWPKSQVTVLSRSFTPAGGKRVVFDAPRWLIDAKWGHH